MEAEASITSLSLMAPTELWMTFSFTSSVLRRSSDSASASTEPCTSALMMSRSSLTSPVWICFCRLSSVMRVEALPRAFSRSERMVAICRALRSSETATSTSPACRHAREPEDLHGVRGAGRLHLPAPGVDERANPPRMGADHDGVALAQRARADERGGDRPATTIESTLDDDALGGPVGIGLELEHFRLQGRQLQELIDPGALLGRGRHEDRLAAPVLGHEPLIGQLTLDAIGLGLGLVDLVDGHDDRHVGRPRVVDRLDRLRHHAVVGGHHQDDDVGGLRAAGAHGGERLVARGVEERDLAVAGHHLVGADVLGDAAELLLGHLGAPDGVEQRRLAVVDVAHDGDDRWPQLQLARVAAGLFLLDDLALDRADLEIEVELIGNELGLGRVEQVVDHASSRRARSVP